MNRGWIATVEARPYTAPTGFPFPLSFAGETELLLTYRGWWHVPCVPSIPLAHESSNAGDRPSHLI
jgi:hypothetical protein